ncbi:peptidoglycan DD-metalloendopeptidase family protein [Sphingorhabdus sp. Alg239-R122]|uniref:murein hydrolase activator EnvC family protein n=1 Tax=Sphingorhabdus sp. Alg239-R122 TaxID=2305989 RepID=UPI0013DB914B|nr:peptidoglycan DD-metalloendopeptidase family protein [Sphingorhabdus sp. Alg239-R122]
MRDGYIGLTLLAAILGLAFIGGQALWSQPVFTEQLGGDQRAALERAKKQAVDARKLGDQLEQQAEATNESADRLGAQVLTMAARIQEAEANISVAEANIGIVAQLQREQRARLAERQKPLVELTAALQNLARRPTTLSLVQPGSIRDMARVRGLLASITPLLRERTADLRTEIDHGKRLRLQAEDAAGLLRNRRGELDSRREELKRLEGQRRVESRQLASNAGLQRDRALAMAEQARDITDLVNRIDVAGEVRESLSLLDGPVLRPARPGEARVLRRDTRADDTRGRFSYRLPVIGNIVTGVGEMSDGGVRSRGLTISTQPYAQVVAPAPGRIAYAGPYEGYNNILIIEHETGWTSLLTGLESISAKVGSQVEQGAPIGRMGRTQRAISVELHRGGQAVDIVQLIAG